MADQPVVGRTAAPLPAAVVSTQQLAGGEGEKGQQQDTEKGTCHGGPVWS
ncbi:MAG: hypothetical protein U5K31_06925 [Balneolaceae bacterium]|nr:hypothetical protein [Balneolaceae bacterium]